jgi:hypothetical protein
LTTVNAIAASDYLLIPTTVDRPSVARIPVLLAWLRRLRDGKDSDDGAPDRKMHLVPSPLDVLAIVGNNVQNSGDWTCQIPAIEAKCRDSWGQAVRCVERSIQSRVYFPRSAKDNRPAVFNTEIPAEPRRSIYNDFTAVAEIVEARLPPLRPLK